ncbi:insulinase family protein [Vibrio misgurnus]|uniref:insulinase family protein n=1 Tax=Vibrio misgurnus TaxID=2993714 RepID=UPI0023F82E97|nr:insulinase family protein [Vibrio sp. VCS]
MHISPNDTNQYRYITLNNGLRTLLIHSPNASKCAAALAVNVGHFDDPIERQGLAHYLEHMLFLGTEKYPKVGEFQHFITQHGGSNNAWTGTEHTCFFFDIAPNIFTKALDRFSQFFIAPLFNPEALDKERQAIDSEYKLKLKDESRRLYQVQKETINPRHPFSQFSVGNAQTLSDGDQSSIRDELLDFYQNHYSAKLMTLVLTGPQSIEQLTLWAENYFAHIPSPPRKLKPLPPFVEREHTGILIQVEPIKELRKLILAFVLPSTANDYRNKPLSYLAHLIGDESQGSLLQALKEQGWITSLSAGGGISGRDYREFAISCLLTPQGLEHVDEIIQSVFQTLDLIASQGLQAWRYQEKRAVLESAFRFQETQRPLDMASHLVINMQHYAAQDTIYGDYIMMGFEQAQLEEILSHLCPENLRATLIAKGGHYDQIAQWYFTPYSVTPFNTEQLRRFRNPLDLPLKLPEPNPFICDELNPADLKQITACPQVLQDLPGFKLWHQQDTEFRVPKGVIYIAIDSPHAVASCRNIAMTRLCVEMFLDTLAKQTYQAEIAGMSYNLYAHQGGVTLTLSGFSQKLPQLMALILNKFAERDFQPQRFNTIKQQLTRHWRNAAHDKPISQLFNALSGLLQPNNPPYADLLAAIETVHVEELASFVEAILAQLHIEMLVYGDWPADQAHQMASVLKQALRVQGQTYQTALRPLVMLGKHGTFQREVDCQQDDSAIVVYYQSTEVSPRNIALYSLANHLMSAAFFDEIRTKQQLGYMVGTGNMPLNRHPGLIMYVQSPFAPPSELIRAIDEFLNALYLVLLELNEYQWHSSKRGLWNQIAAPDPTLRVRAQRLWVAIGNQDLSFDQREQVLQELKTLSRADMIRFVVNQLKPRTAHRLIMHSQGQAHHAQSAWQLGQAITSVEQFQQRTKAYDVG